MIFGKFICWIKGGHSFRPVKINIIDSSVTEATLLCHRCNYSISKELYFFDKPILTNEGNK